MPDSPLASLYSQAITSRRSLDDVMETRKALYVGSIVTFEEASILLKFYHQKIPNICRAFGFPITTQLVAHQLLSHYSLSHTVSDFDLKHVMLACCYMAAKIDNVRIFLNDICSKIPKTNRSSIEDLEFVILKALDYNISSFFSPIPCIFGLLTELGFKEISDDFLNQIFKDLDSVYESEFFFPYSPLGISLSLLKTRISDEQLEFLMNLVQIEETQLFDLQIQPQPLDRKRLVEIDKRIIEYRIRCEDSRDKDDESNE